MRQNTETTRYINISHFPSEFFLFHIVFTIKKKPNYYFLMANRRTSSNSQEDIANSQSELSSSDEIDWDSSDLPVHLSSRIWTTDNFSPRLYEFTDEPGIRISSTENSHPLEYFETFVDEAIVNHIVEETNRYQLQNPVGERQHMGSWTDVSFPEMYSFLATIMLTGILPKNRIRDY
jgi:hypothetical protein